MESDFGMKDENVQKVIKEFLESNMPYWEQKSSEGYKIRIERIF